MQQGALAGTDHTGDEGMVLGTKRIRSQFQRQHLVGTGQGKGHRQALTVRITEPALRHLRQAVHHIVVGDGDALCGVNRLFQCFDGGVHQTAVRRQDHRQIELVDHRMGTGNARRLDVGHMDAFFVKIEEGQLAAHTTQNGIVALVVAIIAAQQLTHIAAEDGVDTVFGAVAHHVFQFFQCALGKAAREVRHHKELQRLSVLAGCLIVLQNIIVLAAQIILTNGLSTVQQHI